MHNFIHLRAHSDYSVTDGIINIKNLVKLAKSSKLFALGLTDLHNMFGMVKFYKECRLNGIKPIVGAEINIMGITKYKVIILVKNKNGLKILSELITKSFIENKILDIPYIKEEWLLKSVFNDLIVLSGGIYGDIGQLIIENKFDNAINKAMLWAHAFPDSYYLELMRISMPFTNELILESTKIARQLNLPLVATHPIQFATADDYIAHEVRVCIAQGEQIDSQSRRSKFTQDQYFMSNIAMQKLFQDIPSAIANTEEIAKRCNLEIELGSYFLPDFITPDSSAISEYLAKIAQDGLKLRLIEIFKSDEAKIDRHQLTYSNRLTTEVNTINQMGFAGYFLIVADFIKWAKDNNIPVGPGRGSGAGSLVAYSLGITDIDPIRYGLLFERFLNPERVSMPDFDIDFCQDKRELVIEYVKNKYGINAVAQIATFGTMTSKAVIKDVGRALSLSYGLCDSLTKLILNTPAKSYNLRESYIKFPELTHKIDHADDDLKRLWELSLQLEDLTRSVGKHAAGVLIAPNNLTNFCPLYVADGMQTSQLDKDDVEDVGLVKFDFLGLRNLTIIQETIENIKELHDINIELSKTNFNDKKTYKLLQKGNSAAIFQLESPGIKRVLIKLEPDRFEDIIAILALYRPGPLGSGMVDDFIKRKKGIDKADYFHKDLKECLESTYGVIVYQEQVMQISQIIGGYTLGNADLLRRAMGKKKPEEMALHKNIFVTGAIKKGYDEALAESLFDLMAKFAEYGFNKSHSAAYAVISYQTAYLKSHYLTCFMAATLSSELDKTDKLYEFYQDCKQNEITVLAPDINASFYRFRALDKKTIIYALGAIKGMGRNIVEAIVNERNKKGNFLSFEDFCFRLGKKLINKRAMEGLIKAGAFDKLEANRAKLLGNINYVLEEIDRFNQNINQGSLFDNAENQTLPQLQLKDYPEYGLKEKLHLEKLAIGYYFSGSLFDSYKDIIDKLNIAPLSKYRMQNTEIYELVNRRGKTKILIAGIINYIGSRPMKKGGRIVFINLEDDLSELEFIAFTEEQERFKHLIKIDELVFVEGELMHDSYRDQIKVVAKGIYSIDEILAKPGYNLQLSIDENFSLDKLKELISREGNATVTLHYTNLNATCKVNFNEQYKFIINYANLTYLTNNLGKDSWSLKLISY